MTSLRSVEHLFTPCSIDLCENVFSDTLLLFHLSKNKLYEYLSNQMMVHFQASLGKKKESSI